MRSWIMAAAAAGAMTTPAVAMQNAGGDVAVSGDRCELHVWGAGRPNFKPRSSFLIKVDPGPVDTSPLSNATLFGSVARAKALSDEELAKLLPGTTPVTIVRHDEIVDLDKAPLKQLTGRLAPSSAPCYADLVIGNLYAIFPNPSAAWQQAGPIGMVLVGSDRLVIEFWLRDFRSSAKPVVFKRKNDSPLPHVPPNSQEMKAALEASANANLGSFTTYVSEQRGR